MTGRPDGRSHAASRSIGRGSGPAGARSGRGRLMVGGLGRTRGRRGRPGGPCSTRWISASTTTGSHCLPAPLAQPVDGLGHRESPAVRPVGRHRVERVGDRHDPGAHRDGVAGEATRVARPVERLVMVQDDVGARPEEVELAQDPRPDLRVEPHRRPLLARERAGLEQDAVGDADLAEVMDSGGLLDELDEPLVQLELVGDFDGVGGDPLRMVEGRRIAVVDDLGEAAHGRARLALQLADVLEGAGDDRSGQHEEGRPERLDDPDQGEDDPDHPRPGLGEERAPAVLAEQIGQRPARRDGHDRVRQGVVDEVVDEADDDHDRDQPEVLPARHERPQVAERTHREAGQRDRQHVARRVERDARKGSPVDDLFDEDRRPHGQRGERRRNQEDRRYVTHRGHRDHAAVGQLDGEELEDDRDQGQDDERPEPVSAPGPPRRAGAGGGSPARRTRAPQ